MQFSLIIIGDEILSGHRQDKHFAQVLNIFKQRGLALEQVLYLGDSRERITQAMKRAIDSGDVVFSCGGIGATPDDHTRQAVAAALGVELALHPEAARLIAERCAERGEPDMSTPENQGRLNMGKFATGADIIPNPFNKIPGFSVQGADTQGAADKTGRLFCVPGFPVMAWPMIEWALDTHYSHLFHSQVQLSEAVLVYGLPESAVTPLMERIERDFAPVKAYSLPSVGEPAIQGGKPHIELGCKAALGSETALAQAMTVLRDTVAQLGGRMEAFVQ
jgi:molybdopterin-biosynthesis enzyme MoeA-like protein